MVPSTSWACWQKGHSWPNQPGRGLFLFVVVAVLFLVVVVLFFFFVLFLVVVVLFFFFFFFFVLVVLFFVLFLVVVVRVRGASCGGAHVARNDIIASAVRRCAAAARRGVCCARPSKTGATIRTASVLMGRRCVSSSVPSCALRKQQRVGKRNSAAGGLPDGARAGRSRWTSRTGDAAAAAGLGQRI